MKTFDSKNKFSFTLDFQKEVLRFFIQSKESMLLLPKVKSRYFTLIEHSLIMESLVKFTKKYHKIPSRPLLIENLNSLLQGKEYAELVTKEDLPNLHRLVDDLYNNPLRDEDVIEENIYKFAAYVEMKMLNESMDFSNFNGYEEYHNKVAKILQESKPHKEEEPLFMVQDTIRRQMKRQINPDVIPTPYWQLNALSNGNGYHKGSIFVLLDKPKAKKTFTLINVARGYLRMKKNVLYIDTENGKNQIMDRMIQSTLSKTKLEMMSGDFDKLEKKHMRKYKRLGVEFIVERVPALVADANYIKSLILKLESQLNIKIHIVMLDYAAKLASIARDKEDTERINNVYIDIDNMASELDLDAIWTAQHVTREGSKHRATRYEDVDIASAISIVRNAQCIMGLNSTEEEEANNIQRWEIVVQRDGKPHGRVLFNIDPDKQRQKEFSREARAAYDQTQGKIVDDMIAKGDAKLGKGKNPNANPERAKKLEHGDI